MRLLILGAGGHAKVVVDAVQSIGIEIAAIVGMPGDPGLLLDHPVVQSPEGVEADGFIAAIGDNGIRARVFTEYANAGLPAAVVIHPSAIVGTGVHLEAGTFVAPGVVINTDARIGPNCVLNTGCHVDHDCVIGSHAHVGPGVALCGGVTLGEGVLMGVGSCATPGASVGDWSVVGAGAAVVGELPAQAVCVGVPARFARHR